MLEIWKEVEGTGGQYLISNCGNVRSVGNDKKRKDKILKTYSYSKKGHEKVDLRVNGKVVKKSVHRLVAEAFLPNPSNHPAINHKDNNPKNNYVDNLEWCTFAYNLVHYYANFHFYKNPKYCNLIQDQINTDQYKIDKFCISMGLTREELREIL